MEKSPALTKTYREQAHQTQRKAVPVTTHEQSIKPYAVLYSNQHTSRAWRDRQTDRQRKRQTDRTQYRKLYFSRTVV